MFSYISFLNLLRNLHVFFFFGLEGDKRLSNSEQILVNDKGC